MKTTAKLVIAISAALAMASAAHAQSSTSGGMSSNTGNTTTSNTSGTRSSSMYAPGATYLGFNIGQSNFALSNGFGNFSSESRKNSYSLYGGSYFSEYLGAELGYIDFDRVNRAGGSTRADAFSVSLVGKLPIAPAFNLLGKVGTTYGRTNVSANPTSGIVGGKESSWNLSYGVGAEYDFTPSWSGVLQYDEYRMKFAGTGNEKIGNTSIGVRYKF